jgi:hypothetical protein
MVNFCGAFLEQELNAHTAVIIKQTVQVNLSNKRIFFSGEFVDYHYCFQV